MAKFWKKIVDECHFELSYSLSLKITFLHRYFGPPAVAGGSYELGVFRPSVNPSVRPSVRPSFRLSGRFLGIASLDFFEILHGDTDLCKVVRNGAGFFKKIRIAPKRGKMGPKWAQNRVFQDFSKNFTLNFSGFSLK